MTYGLPEPERESSDDSFPRSNDSLPSQSIDEVATDLQPVKTKRGLWEKSVVALNNLTMLTGVTLIGVAGVTGVYSLLEGRQYSGDTDMLFGIGLGLLYVSIVGYEAGKSDKE